VRGVGVRFDIWVDVDGGGIVESRGLVDVDGGATEVDKGKGDVVDEGGWDTMVIASGVLTLTSPGCASAYHSDNDKDGGPAYAV
jgi:hypothetical protein